MINASQNSHESKWISIQKRDITKVFGEAKIPVKGPNLDKGLQVERIVKIQEVPTISQENLITFKHKQIDAAIETNNVSLMR